MKIVYITGCLGFIGSYVTKMALEKGWYVKGIDKISYAANRNLLKDFESYENFSFIKSDINDLKFLYECDFVINTAAETHVGNSIVSSEEFIHSNINGTHKLLELIRNYRGEGKQKPVLIHFSTDEVYGDLSEGYHSEKDLLKPSNPYSATKAAADSLIMAWNRTYGQEYVIVRPTNNYGIGQYVEKLIPKTIKCLGLGKKVPLHNNGTPVRNWLHASDSASAVISIIESGTKNEIFNISGNFEQSNLETVSQIINIYDKTLKIEDCIDLSFSRNGQDVRYALDDSKIKNIGWQPKADFSKELIKIVEHYTNNFIW